MKPKNFKSLTKGIAEEVGVHEDVVIDFINFYYGEVRKNLSSLTDPKVYVENLGTFSVMKTKLKRKLDRQQEVLENIDLNTYKGYDKHISVILKIEQMQNVMRVMEERNTEYKKFKEKS